MSASRHPLFVLGLLALAEPVGAARAQQEPPRLTVVLVVDQMRADHLTRFAGLYEQGLARLLGTGSVFTEALHDHARTETAPGHATIATGAFPSQHGVVSNDWYDAALGRLVYSVEDADAPIVGQPHRPGRSPRSLRRTTLGDWLRAASPGSKVYSVSAKDRSAILAGGRRPDGAYWYEPTDGSIRTSTYYRPDYPSWVDSFNLERLADDYVRRTWEKLKAVEFYFVSREDSFPAEYDGVNVAFPHDSRAPFLWGRRYDELLYTPFSDELLFEFGRSVVLNEQLGTDNAPDLLWMGLSAADYIGHRYGPLSQESQDHFLRLDRYLGQFFQLLDDRIGSDNYIVVLTADHGVLPVPEELQRRGVPARRLSLRTLLEELDGIASTLAAELGVTSRLFNYVGGGVAVNYEAVSALTREELRSLLTARLLELPFVAGVYPSEGSSVVGDADTYARQYRQNAYPGRSPDLAIRFAPFTIVDDDPGGTTHGSPYRWDALVPLVFAGGGITPGQHRGAVRTVDIAPTIAAMLHILPDEGVAGRSLLPQLRGER